MINQISVNSNNTIELSRGDLLAWVNDLLNTNLIKIQQLGTGAIYCQMLDLLYPGKVQLNKINFKAKNDYEYINNFKLLQQYFTKFGIMKNIEVERLIKCKYQDNLQFLQWFKKIFDNHFLKPDHDLSIKRSTSDHQLSISLEKENKKPTRALNFDHDTDKNNINQLLKLQFSKQPPQKPTHTATSRTRNETKIKRSNSIFKPSTERNHSFEAKIDVSLENMQTDEIGLPKSGIKAKQLLNSQTKEPYYSPSKFIEKQNFYRDANENQGFCNQERQFYMKKFKEIEHLLQVYETNPHCQKLVGQIRRIIFLTPQVKQWSVNQETGELICLNVPQSVDRHDMTSFNLVPEEKLSTGEKQ